MATPIVLILLVSAATASASGPRGARLALGMSIVAILLAAVVGRPVLAEGGYWLAVGTLMGVVAMVLRALARRFSRSKLDR